MLRGVWSVDRRNLMIACGVFVLLWAVVFLAVAVQPLAAAAVIAVAAAAVLASRGLLGFGLTFLGVLTSCASGVQIGSLLTLPDLFLLPAAGLALVMAVATRRVSAPLWLVFPAGGILVWGLIAGLFSDPPTYRYLFQFVGFMLLVPLTVAFYGSTRRRIATLAGAYLASGTINAALATLDARGIWHIASQIRNVHGFEFSDRYTGLSNHSNQLGLVCVMAVPIALYFAERRKAALLTLPILFLGAATSGSRGALLGLPLSIALYVIVARKNIGRRLAWTAVGLAVGVVAAVILGLTVGIDRLTPGNATAIASDQARISLMDRALAEFWAHPFTGVGFSLPSAHDIYIELARSGGLLASALFIVFAVLAIRRGYITSRYLPVITGAWASQTSWLLLAVQHNALFERFLWVPTGLVIAGGILVAQQRAATRAQPERLEAGPSNAPEALVEG